MLTGENGILGKATTAKNKNDGASVEEKIKLSVMYSRMNTNGDTNINLDELEKELEKNFDDVSISKKGANEALPWIVTSNGYMFEITETGEVKKVNGIALNKSNLNLLEGERETITAELTQGATEELIATPTPTTNVENLKFSSSNGQVKVEEKGQPDENGNVKVKITVDSDAGENSTAVITVQREKTSNIIATCNVKVIKAVEPEIGDFVDYHAGNWTQSDLDKLGEF